ncbi:MAG TPA: ATP-binding protein, partial [Bacteroidetes bacterium]|nr:ATP-binding protein [Bacteroidota bacterium]
MGLPIDILKLLTGQTIEWDRIEFKKGWNPEPILHTICAFANDINNWGGGYIIVGVEEKNGRPILPPIGLELDTIDAIQKSLQELCHKIQPNYFPVTIPTMVEGKWIFVIWVAGGDNRPYKAPKLLRKGGQAFHYVRRGSVTKIAKDDVSRQLFELAAKVPFDDRINHHASIDDINFQLIRSFLRKVNSDLYANSETIQFKDLCRQMQIVRGPDENL